MSTSARADCANPRAFFAPLEAATLPTSGVTYLFTPWHHWQKPPLTVVVTAKSGGKSVPIKLEAASTAPDYRAWRVSWTDLPAGQLTLRAVDSTGAKVAIRNVVLSKTWKRPKTAAGPLVKSRSTTRSSSWMCSHDLLRHQPVETVADVYRVTFNPSVGRTGKNRTQFFPGDINRFFGGTTRSAGLSFGHVSCFGRTHKWRGEIAVDIEALAADGSTLSSSKNVRLQPPKGEPNQPPFTGQ